MKINTKFLILGNIGLICLIGILLLANESSKKESVSQKTEDMNGVTNTPDDCARIENQEKRDECYGIVAEADKDTNTCGKIQNQEVKDKCYSHIVKSTQSSIGGKTGETSGGSEEGGSTEGPQDPAICNEIVNIELREECYFYISKATRDSSICDQIQDEFWQQRCYSETTV
jgi:hypothetical protein